MWPFEKKNTVTLTGIGKDGNEISLVVDKKDVDSLLSKGLLVKVGNKLCLTYAGSKIATDLE